MNPTISVVTVCYQAVNTIEETILSVINQTYKNIEYIVIDGGSTDGTVDIIKRYAPHIAFWSSEPDKGIYDAMNKGMSHASGEWISFINSGDRFYNHEVISSVFSHPRHKYNILYGDTQFVRPNGTFIESSFPPQWLQKNMPTCHQSFFVKTAKAKAIGFSLKYKYAADYNMIYQLFLESGTECVLHLPVVVSTYNACEGSSMERPNEVFHETLKIRKKSFDKFYGYIRYYIKKLIGRR